MNIEEKGRRMRKKLREMLDRDERIIVPGVANAYYAKIAEKLGFKAVYVSSFQQHAMKFALPDIDFIDRMEMVYNLQDVVEAVDIPVFCDGEGGWGGPLQMMRTVRMVEKAGAAAMQMTDKAEDVCPYIGYVPYGAFPEKILLPIERVVEKVRAAVSAREDPNFLIYLVGGAGLSWDKFLPRARALMDAGLDFFHMGTGGGGEARSFDQIRRYAEEARSIWPKMPLKTSVPGGIKDKDIGTAKQLTEAGFNIVILSIDCLLVTAKAWIEYLKEYKETGKSNDERLLPLKEFLDIVEVDKWKKLTESCTKKSA